MSARPSQTVAARAPRRRDAVVHASDAVPADVSSDVPADRPGDEPDHGSADARSDARPSDVSRMLYVATSELHGLGMFAAEPIEEDIVLGRLAGMPTYDDGTYVLWLTDELGLEVTNDFRFINHSSDPNCALTDVDVVTLRAVDADEELTHDYGWN